MPLNNSINKTSDTFFATSNITANFTSPVTITRIQSIDRTNAIAVVAQANNLAALSCEFYNSNTGDTYQSIINMGRAFGTKASPLTTSGLTQLGQINFCRFASGSFDIDSFIRAFNQSGVPTLTFGLQPNGGDRFIMRSAAIKYVGSASFNAITWGAPGVNDFNDFNANAEFFVDAYSTTSRIIGAWTAAGGGGALSGGQNYPITSVASITNATANIGARIFLGRNRSGTYTTATKVEQNDELGGIFFNGADGTISGTRPFYKSMASIVAFCDGATANNDVPGRIVISTTPDGSTTLSETMRLDNAGRVTQIRQPSFSASLSADVANATGDGTAYTIAFNTEQYDQGSNFAANTFTAPIAGKYRFNWTISVDDLLVGHTKMEVTVGGQTVCRVNPYAIADSDGFCLLNGSVDLSLAASATVTMVVTISGSTKTVTVKGTTTSGTFLSGQLQV